MLQPKFKLKKLARIQMLRETEVVAALLYKVVFADKTSNQLRQWPGLKRIKWASKCVRALANEGRGLVQGQVDLVRQALFTAGEEVRAKVVEGWLLPAMTIYYASIA